MGADELDEREALGNLLTGLRNREQRGRDCLRRMGGADLGSGRAIGRPQSLQGPLEDSSSHMQQHVDMTARNRLRG